MQLNTGCYRFVLRKLRNRGYLKLKSLTAIMHPLTHGSTQSYYYSFMIFSTLLYMIKNDVLNYLFHSFSPILLYLLYSSPFLLYFTAHSPSLYFTFYFPLPFYSTCLSWHPFLPSYPPSPLFVEMFRHPCFDLILSTHHNSLFLRIPLPVTSALVAMYSREK